MRSVRLSDFCIMKIKQIALGSQGLVVPVIGLGCMGMTGFEEGNMYGPADEQEAIATIHRSLELGGNFLDTADLYGPLKNEQLIAKAISGQRHQYILATKFGWEIDDNNKVTWKINGKKEYVKKSLERSLKNLNTDYIDLYYLHRLDKNTPIEETVEAMAGLVKEGKVGYIGLRLCWCCHQQRFIHENAIRNENHQFLCDKILLTNICILREILPDTRDVCKDYYVYNSAFV